MRISLLVEGDTERVFLPTLRAFLSQHLSGKMPNLVVRSYDGRIPKGDKLRRVVEDLLTKRPTPADAVIALTDVYTGSSDFTSAADAKAKMRTWVPNNDRFYPHVAQHDFEAWLLPYWSTIQKLAGHNMAAPSGRPEQVNHQRPPAARIKEIFERGKCCDSYVKPRDALRILKDNDLTAAVDACPELKNLSTPSYICQAAQPCLDRIRIGLRPPAISPANATSSVHSPRLHSSNSSR
ncbi:MAG: DUF4276 family protein [Polyangiaceae bacterium]|nr:DUF4276 family protein [Polyangiaceae bacterium]